jgi:oligopeptide transport system substrate-binding protein
MRSRRAFRSVTAWAVAGSLVLAGCGSSGSDEESQESSTPISGGTLVDLQNFAGGDPDHIDPALASDAQSSQIADLVFDGLTDTTDSGEIRPSVASEITSNDAATVWTFELRDDVRFDNTDPVRPSDFKFAWERVVRLESDVAYHLQNIAGFEEVASQDVTTLSGVVANDDERTLEVTLEQPRRDFDSLVSLPVFSPVPTAVFEANEDDELLAEWEQSVMVGNGPFQMAEPWERGRSITLRRNANYFGGIDGHRAYLDTVEFRISQDIGSAYNDFESGSGQVGRIPPGRYTDATNRYGSDVVNSPILQTEYWGFNMRSESVGGPDNLDLRRAIALAMDKEDTVEKVYGGARPAATGIAPPALPGFEERESSTTAETEEARQLLSDWGRQVPEVQLTFPAGLGHEDKATILAQNLEEIGITATPEPLDRAAFGQAMATNSADIFWGAWRADYVSYDNFIGPMFSTETIGQDNVTNYSNGRVDDLIASARAEADPDTASEQYREAENIILDDQVIIPLSWSTAGLVTAPEVEDFVVKPLGTVAYQNTWLQR